MVYDGLFGHGTEAKESSLTGDDEDNSILNRDICETSFRQKSVHNLFKFRIVLHSSLAFEVSQHAHFLEFIQQRLGLGLVLFHSSRDDLLSIVFSDHEVVPAVVAHSVLLWK